MEISEKQKVIADQKGELDFHKSKIADLQHQIDMENKEIEKNIQSIRKFQVETNQLREELNVLSADKYYYEITLKELQQKHKRILENTTKLKKENEKLKKNFKKEELHCQQAFEIINQNQRVIEKIQKEESEIKREIQSFSQTKEKINDDISLIGTGWALF